MGALADGRNGKYEGAEQDLGERLSNPVNVYIEHKRKSQSYRIYDKETKKSTNLDTLHFIPLKEFVSVQGQDLDTEEGYFSNMVKDVSKGVLKVWKKTGGSVKIAHEGLWKDIKQDIPYGVKFTKVIFAVVLDTPTNPTTFKLAQITLQGSSLGVYAEKVEEWRNKTGKEESKYFAGWTSVGFKPYSATHQKVYLISTGGDWIEQKKSGNKFNSPVFTKEELSLEGEIMSKIIEDGLEDLVDAYMDDHLARNTSTQEEIPQTENIQVAPAFDDFPTQAHEAGIPPIENAPVEDDTNPDDMPF